ncbi:hypothetical protein FQ377_07355 [Arthrobacter echini]|uniref:Uncharacterized protein n=1 Tax=Arthrobacter echini TaxID=1529066 RepID=A0A5D0XRU3_9MICC|nr:hypothetical protein [Arthrobacter echini]TYC98827.1 hypothetical protein FQ377_07355 [Arthrobacter echini]
MIKAPLMPLVMRPMTIRNNPTPATTAVSGLIGRRFDDVERAGGRDGEEMESPQDRCCCFPRTLLPSM